METQREAGVLEATELYGGTALGFGPLAANETNEVQVPRPKVCPILWAATMVLQLGIQDFRAYCLGNLCAWYEHGCPAYPGKEER